jgi:tetratricopeptide (TPR) repeat protein
MPEPLTVAASKAGEALAWDLVKAGARGLGRQILGTPAEHGMRDVYARAIAGLLIEVGQAGEESGAAPDPEAMKVAETVLEGMCSDDEAAGLLLNVALRADPVPVEALRERAAELGYEPGTLPFAFDGAMRVLADKVWEEFLAEAGKDNSPIQPLVNAELLIAMREQRLALRTLSSAGHLGSLLPPPPGLVLGRVNELDRAKQALGVVGREGGETEPGPVPPSRRVVAVHGWPGIGKSTFVAALCRDGGVLEYFSGGVLFVPVGRSPDVRRLAEEVCAALGSPAPPGTTLDALRGRIAEALSQRSVLVVLDDVWEERHVAPLLLAGGGSAALVATRRLDVATRLSTAPDGPLKLGLLSEEDSLELLASRAPGVVAEHEGACRDLARVLDGLPLALRVAADLLRVESEAGFDVSDLLGELTEAARVLDEEVPHDAGSGVEDGAEGAAATVRLLLRRSIERLDGETVKRFARLGVLPPKPLSFDPWTAQDVWRDTAEDIDLEAEEQEEEQNRTRRALGDLVRRGLVESAAGGVEPLAVKLDLRSKRPERFWMHALVAAFALEILEDTEGEGGVREVQQRRLEHYRRIVGAANEAARQGGETQYFGVLLLTLDLPNIRAAHEWARVRTSEDRRALEYLSRLPAQGRRVLSERLAPGEFLDWMMLAEEAARSIGDEDESRSHREAVGAALLQKGQLQEALAYCEESLEAARLSEDSVAEGTALANLASIRNAMGQHQAALGLAYQAQEALKYADSPDVEAGAIGQQAEALEGLGRLPEAKERYEARRNLASSEGELSHYARALRGLARIKRERPEERDEAGRLYDEAAQVFWDLKQYDNYRGALNGKGALEIKAGSLGAAEDLFRRALSSAVDDGHEGDQARAKMNLGIAYQERGTKQGYEAAEAEYREALPLAYGWDEPDLIGDVLLNLAQLLYYYMGDYRNAWQEAASAAEAYRRAGSAKESWARELMDEIDRANG